MQSLHKTFPIGFLLKNWKYYVKYLWNDTGKVSLIDQNGEFQTFRVMFQKPSSQISGIILHDDFSHSFQYYFLKSFEKVFAIFLVLFKGIQKKFQEIFRNRFANFIQNISDRISVKKLEILREIFLKWFRKGFFNRSKRRDPNILSNVSKTMQSDFRNYFT